MNNNTPSNHKEVQELWDDIEKREHKPKKHILDNDEEKDDDETQREEE